MGVFFLGAGRRQRRRRMADELKDKILEDAQSPKRVRGDSGEVEQHDLKDLVEADRYLAGKNALKKKPFGLRFAQLVPPGAD